MSKCPQSDQYLGDLMRRYPQLAACRDDIIAACEMLGNCYRSSKKALICGNGGSAADCEHWAGEMLKGFICRRPVARENYPNLPADLASGLQCALPMIPLTGFTSLSSAFANDVDHKLVFAQLVWALAKEGDVVIGISTSGNSPSVRCAMQAAAAAGARTLGLTGSGGGKLAELCDVCIKAPADKTYMIQELHLPIYHTLSLMLEAEFFPPRAD